MQQITALTVEERGTLKKMPDVKIQWRLNKRSKFEVVVEKFPRAILMTFSPVANVYFTTAAPGANKYIVEGGSVQIYKFIFDWILKCCEEHIITPFSTLATTPFLGYLHVYIAAQSLEISCLKNDMFTRLNTLAQAEIQCEGDVNVIYNTFPKGHPLRIMIAKGTGRCFATGKFGKIGKTYEQYFYAIVEEFEDDSKRHFKQELTVVDPYWEEEMRFRQSQRGMHQYRRFEREE